MDEISFRPADADRHGPGIERRRFRQGILADEHGQSPAHGPTDRGRAERLHILGLLHAENFLHHPLQGPGVGSAGGRGIATCRVATHRLFRPSVSEYIASISPA
jgi:hypothetical protein